MSLLAEPTTRFFADGEDFLLLESWNPAPAGAIPVPELEAAELVASWRRRALSSVPSALRRDFFGGPPVGWAAPWRLLRVPPWRPAQLDAPRAQAVDLRDLLGFDAAKQEADHFIEIVVFDAADAPLAGQLYELELPDGKHRTGKTDDNGSIRVDAIFKAGKCRVHFPELEDVA
jgi:hypothetical protein